MTFFTVIIMASPTIIATSAIAADTETTFDLYEALDPAQNYAVCAVAANLSLPKDDLLSEKYLLEFRKEKSIPKFISDGFLLDLGRKWIKKNKYEHRMAEVYTLCLKDAEFHVWHSFRTPNTLEGER